MSRDRSPADPMRRRVLATGAGLCATLAVRPSSAADDFAAAIASFANGAEVRAGRVAFDIPKLVDNGNAVPVTVTVDSPMTPADHVVAIAIFNERNPERDVLRCALGLRAGRARVSARIRLATSQKVVALARMSDGSVWSDTVDVVVVLAACLEGDI